MREDAGRGWRRVVPSPEPMEIVELEAIRALLEGGVLVVCAGGGGVPVVRSRGALSGIDAVIDKDLAAALLAAELGADALLILTDVPQAYIHYDTPEQQALATVSVEEMEGFAAEGHFKAGSMGPQGRRLPALRARRRRLGHRQPHRGRAGAAGHGRHAHRRRGRQGGAARAPRETTQVQIRDSRSGALAGRA
jgi:hypothetical protein